MGLGCLPGCPLCTGTQRQSGPTFKCSQRWEDSRMRASSKISLRGLGKSRGWRARKPEEQIYLTPHKGKGSLYGPSDPSGFSAPAGGHSPPTKSRFSPFSPPPSSGLLLPTLGLHSRTPETLSQWTVVYSRLYGLSRALYPQGSLSQWHFSEPYHLQVLILLYSFYHSHIYTHTLLFVCMYVFLVMLCLLSVFLH